MIGSVVGVDVMVSAVVVIVDAAAVVVMIVVVEMIAESVLLVAIVLSVTVRRSVRQNQVKAERIADQDHREVIVRHVLSVIKTVDHAQKAELLVRQDLL